MSRGGMREITPRGGMIDIVPMQGMREITQRGGTREITPREEQKTYHVGEDYDRSFQAQKRERDHAKC